MQVIERDVDLMGAAVMAGNCRAPSRTQRHIIMMSFFEKKARHKVRCKHKKSGSPSCHLCPYLER